MLAWVVRILTFIACMGLLQCHKPDKGNATCDSTALLQRRKQRMLEAESDGQNQTKGSAFSKWYSYQWHSRRRSRHYGASGAISRLHREIDSLQRRIGGSANRLDDQIVDLESTLYNLTENLNAQTTELERKIESLPVSPRESNAPISIFDGFCDPGAAKLPPRVYMQSVRCQSQRLLRIHHQQPDRTRLIQRQDLAGLPVSQGHLPGALHVPQ